MIEMKQHPDPKALANATVDAVRAAGMEGRVVLASFETALLLQANLRDSSMPLLGLAEDTKGIEAMLRLPITVLGVSVELAEEAMRTVPQGIAVWIWTVYTPADAKRLAELGVHGIITDAPTAIIAELRKTPDLMVER
jgi:glycerophosphoryl diester phosphodiesterase